MKYFISTDLFTGEKVIIDQNDHPIAAFSTLEDARCYLESLIVKPKS